MIQVVFLRPFNSTLKPQKKLFHRSQAENAKQEEWWNQQGVQTSSDSFSGNGKQAE